MYTNILIILQAWVWVRYFPRKCFNLYVASTHLCIFWEYDVATLLLKLFIMHKPFKNPHLQNNDRTRKCSTHLPSFEQLSKESNSGSHRHSRRTSHSKTLTKLFLLSFCHSNGCNIDDVGTTQTYTHWQGHEHTNTIIPLP